MVVHHNQENICANKKKFIELYPQYGTIGATLKTIGVKSRVTFYNWCNADSEFKAIYEQELLPNRRDTLASQVYQTAISKQHVAICPVCEGRGKYDDKQCHGCKGKGWVEVHGDTVQLTACFGFLKATDHCQDEHDRLVFTEKNQVEQSGEIVIKVVYESDKGNNSTPAQSSNTLATK